MFEVENKTLFAQSLLIILLAGGLLHNTWMDNKRAKIQKEHIEITGDIIDEVEYNREQIRNDDVFITPPERMNLTDKIVTAEIHEDSIDYHVYQIHGHEVEKTGIYDGREFGEMLTWGCPMNNNCSPEVYQWN